MFFIISLINALVQIITLLVLVDVILSYFMDPYQPVRHFFDRLVQPLLNPIRQRIPPLSGFDISPIILILLIQILGTILVNLLVRIG